jgi:hypothetical protein
MRELKRLYARIVAPCIIGGRQHQPGELVSVDSNSYRQLLSDALAVPSAGPLAAALATTDIRPFFEDTTP